MSQMRAWALLLVAGLSVSACAEGTDPVRIRQQCSHLQVCRGTR